MLRRLLSVIFSLKHDASADFLKLHQDAYDVWSVRLRPQFKHNYYAWVHDQLFMDGASKTAVTIHTFMKNLLTVAKGRKHNFVLTIDSTDLLPQICHVVPLSTSLASLLSQHHNKLQPVDNIV